MAILSEEPLFEVLPMCHAKVGITDVYTLDHIVLIEYPEEEIKEFIWSKAGIYFYRVLAFVFIKNIMVYYQLHAWT